MSCARRRPLLLTLLFLCTPLAAAPADAPAADAEYVKVLRRLVRLSRAFVESDRKLVSTFEITTEQRAAVGKEYAAALAAYDGLLRQLDEGVTPSKQELDAALSAGGRAEGNVRFALGDKSVDLTNARRPRYDMMRMPHAVLWHLHDLGATPGQMVAANRVLQPLFDVAADCPPVAPAKDDREAQRALAALGARANDALRTIGPELRKVVDEQQWKQVSAAHPILEMRHLQAPPAPAR